MIIGYTCPIFMDYDADDDDDDDDSDVNDGYDDDDDDDDAETGVAEWLAGREQGLHGGQWCVRLYGREQRRIAARRAPSARYQYVSIHIAL